LFLDYIHVHISSSFDCFKAPTRLNSVSSKISIDGCGGVMDLVVQWRILLWQFGRTKECETKQLYDSLSIFGFLDLVICYNASLVP
jgi:hypothetical protein